MKRKSEIDLSPLDIVALYQSRELDRRKRIIRKVWMRLVATLFVSSPKRYMQPVEEARGIAAKEASRLFALDHPKKSKPRKRTKGGTER